MSGHDYEVQHESHCIICRMGLVEEFNDLYIQGKRAVEIAKELSDMYGVDINEATVRRHIRYIKRLQDANAFDVDLFEPKIDLEQFKNLSDIERAKIMIKELDAWILQIGQVIGAFATKKHFSMLRTYASAIQALGRVLDALTRFRDQLAERIERKEGIDSNELFDKFRELFEAVAMANGMVIEEIQEDGEPQDVESKAGHEK